MDATKSISWLHISDLHFRSSPSYDSDRVLAALLSSLPTITARTGAPQLVFVTGDIGFSGRAAEYNRATEFFDKLLQSLGIGKERLFVVPGNHDVDRSRPYDLARTLVSLQQADSYFEPGLNLPHLDHRQKAFGEWFDSFFDGVM